MNRLERLLKLLDEKVGELCINDEPIPSTEPLQEPKLEEEPPTLWD